MLLESNRFSFDNGVFVAEASDLEWRTQIPHSFRMLSVKTGNIVEFQLARRETDNEGDVLAWHYNPEPKYRECIKSCIVFND